MNPALASYPETYYTATTPLPAPLPALAEAVDTDVCVVGGGLAGCSAALELAERGFRVVLLEGQ
ncbi:MAG TPA: FAD-dependent oxidoreductase, partial [Thermoanaerobaculia bacterium]|nr:FAD-dependent oxidoreductase [Thermoanaerobaculia bacterium]